jgi:hypothetical protein
VVQVAEGILVALFITVRKVARSRDFYSRVLGGTVMRDARERRHRHRRRAQVHFDPASTATSPTASASASLTSSGRRGGEPGAAHDAF